MYWNVLVSGDLFMCLVGACVCVCIGVPLWAFGAFGICLGELGDAGQILERCWGDLIRRWAIFSK